MMTDRIKLIIGCVIFVLASAQAAEEETIVLTIDGDKIDVLDSFDELPADRYEALLLVDAYHRLLDGEVLDRVSSQHEKILALIPDFEVAYAAADSAENDNVMSDIDALLANIRSVHAREFNEEVSRLLREAYQLILPVIGDD